MAPLTERASSQPAAPDSAPEGSAREQVSQIQRARIVAAMIAVASEQGIARATIARVVGRSGVSRRTFYEQFGDREECFLAAFDQTVESIGAPVARAYEAPLAWRVRVRAALTALLEAFDLERAAARLAIVEALGAGPKALEHRREALARISDAIDEGRREGRGAEGPPPMTAEGIVGGVFSLIHSRLLEDRDAALMDLLNPIVSMVVLPYLGSAAARRELVLPVPLQTGEGDEHPRDDPLRGLDMRLTYRTVRVLLAIGACSGASNRQVADASGIRDQGQISKLLTRLERLALIENLSANQIKGEPNAWALTQRGADVHVAISSRTPKPSR
jgi:AcrR family transcriptional regulator